MAAHDSGRVAWKESFSVGDTLIDAQHRAFLIDLDAVMDAVEGGAPREAVLTFYGQFLADLSTHFHDEENLLQRAGFPCLQDHIDEHKALLSSVTAIESLLVTCEAVAELHYVVRSLFSSLVEHMISEDMRYRGWLRRHNPNNSR